MQKFTRALTREIEVSGERLAVTLDEKGLTLRPVGSRRPPHTLSWAGCVCACAGAATGSEPGSEAVQAALQALRAGAPREKSSSSTPAASTPDAEPATEPPAAAAAAAAPPPATGGGSLTGLLERVDHWLKSHRHKFHQALRPGAGAADLDHLQQQLGVPLPAEVRAWLSWHNGQGDDYVGSFEESWNLMSAQEIADAKKELDAASHPGWKKSYVPFLTDDRDDYLCLDADHPGGPVRACWRDQQEHPVVAPSLAAWVESFLTGLEQGTYHEDPERGTFLRRQNG